MPLRDHFRPPIELRHSWEALYGGWPALIVQTLDRHLPAAFIPAPRLHLRSRSELKDSAFVHKKSTTAGSLKIDGGGVAIATQAPPQPILILETDVPDQDEYEVRIHDDNFGRRLVAAIEIISPSNKDRPASRRAFVGKVAALLQHNVCVTLVDVVAIRRFNLYAELLELYDVTDPSIGREPPFVYAVTIRARKRLRQKSVLECWFHPMQIGQSLPTLPVWLDEELYIPLQLESSYEETCRYLRIA